MGGLETPPSTPAAERRIIDPRLAMVDARFLALQSDPRTEVKRGIVYKAYEPIGWTISEGGITFTIIGEDRLVLDESGEEPEQYPWGRGQEFTDEDIAKLEAFADRLEAGADGQA